MIKNPDFEKTCNTAAETVKKLSKIFNSAEIKGGFVIVDVCPNCGNVTITECKHNSCYNNQCECGYLSGFIGRNHAN